MWRNEKKVKEGKEEGIDSIEDELESLNIDGEEEKEKKMRIGIEKDLVRDVIEKGRIGMKDLKKRIEKRRENEVDKEKIDSDELEMRIVVIKRKCKKILWKK